MLADTLQDDDLRKLAVAVYVAYRTVNHVRHRTAVSSQYIRDFFNQMLHEATRDDDALRRCCAGLAPVARRRAKRTRPA